MKIHFEDKSDTYVFLEFCRLIAYVLEENENFKNKKEKKPRENCTKMFISYNQE